MKVRKRQQEAFNKTVDILYYRYGLDEERIIELLGWYLTQKGLLTDLRKQINIALSKENI